MFLIPVPNGWLRKKKKLITYIKSKQTSFLKREALGVVFWKFSDAQVYFFMEVFI